MSRKQIKKYTILLEGQNEADYFQKFKELINSYEWSKYTISINTRVIRNNFASFIKRNSSISLNTTIYFVYDHEGNENDFKKNVLDNIKDCKNIKKGMRFILGYTNLSIELWILLHKTMCKNKFNRVEDYLKPINKQFNENFEALREFKQEKNFKRCLNQITLEDVKNAINRADEIMSDLEKDGYKQINYNKFKYYNENPSLTVHEIVKTILLDCEINFKV